MKVDQKGHTTIIKDTQNNVEAFVEKINNAYNTFQGQNLILDISHDKAVSLRLIKCPPGNYLTSRFLILASSAAETVPE
jgi:hypothetical protein